MAAGMRHRMKQPPTIRAHRRGHQPLSAPDLLIDRALATIMSREP